jgi:hypothetical protein
MPTLTMAGPLSECLLLAYRTPAASVEGIAPKPLKLITRGGFAFWNLVVCRVDGMRPAGLPKFLGVSYHHVAYRLYVSAQTADGQEVQGLYFVRSDADSRLLCLGGEWMTDFRFHYAPVALEKNGDQFEAWVPTRDPAGCAHLKAEIALAHQLAEGSPFDDVEEAKRVLKYQPLGLAVGGGGRKLKLAEVMREESAWRERPLRVLEADWGFFRAMPGQSEAKLEIATRVDPIDYRWRLGRSLSLKSGA